jgi:8-oxo-dGTP diphosphatase
VFTCHDDEGQVLLARRGPGARDEPGVGDTGAGALEHGESFESAATREVREEYSAEVLEIETIGVRNVLRGDPVSHWVASSSRSTTPMSHADHRRADHPCPVDAGEI